jgi:hypothetical protein
VSRQRPFGFTASAASVRLVPLRDAEPEGEWVHLEARTFISPDGTGVAEGVLSDLRGRCGRSIQSLILEPRPPR